MVNIYRVCNDQPGRVLACFLFAPIIGFKGIDYKDAFLILFAILLFSWDMYWIIFKAPAVVNC